MLRRLALLPILLLLVLPLGSDAGTGSAAGLVIDRSRSRSLEEWRPRIRAYSARHYGEGEWRLEPRCIVVHYTAGATFPWNLVNSTEFAGEEPGLASHYVVDGLRVWEILPPSVRCRATYGINHRALSIEMVALDANDLAVSRRKTLDTTARLIASLLSRYRIPAREVYSHQQVATMDRQVVPWVLDLVDSSPYHKVDPGEENLRWLRLRVAQLLP